MRIGLQPVSILSSHVAVLGVQTMRGTFAVGGDPANLRETMDRFPLMDFVTVRQTGPPTDMLTWRAQVTVAVQIMRGRVKRLGFGNEPFIESAQGDNWTGTPAEFAQTSEGFVDAVHEADPGMIVVTPGLCSGCIEARSERVEQLLMLPRLYPAVPMEVDLHLYRGWQTAASHVAWAQGISGRPVIVTECGADTAGGVMQLLTVLDAAGVTDALYHALTPVETDSPPFQAMSLLDGGKESPRYWAYKTWGQTIVDRCVIVSVAEGLHYYQAGKVHVLWADMSLPVRIPVSSRRAERIDPIGGVSQLVVRGREVRLNIGPEPCYVREV